MPEPQIFTVTRKGGKDPILSGRYTLTVSTLPGRSWTCGFREMSDDLFVTALLSRAEARNLLLDAWALGSASTAGHTE